LLSLSLGYRGIIIGITTSDESYDEFTNDGLVQITVRRPIANRELQALLSSDAFIAMSDRVVINNTASVDKITREELEQSITFNSNALGTLTRAGSIMSMGSNQSLNSPALRTSPNGSHPDHLHGSNGNHVNFAAKDSNDSLVADDENLQDFSTSPARRETSTPDMNRLVWFHLVSFLFFLLSFSFSLLSLSFSLFQ
jgi:hypothetical protein